MSIEIKSKPEHCCGYICPEKVAENIHIEVWKCHNCWAIWITPKILVQEEQ